MLATAFTAVVAVAWSLFAEARARAARPKAPQAALSRAMSKERDGRPMPILEVRYPKGTHHRLVAAKVYELAAKAERATDPGEAWSIETFHFADESGRLSVHLARNSESEARRALAMLHRVH